MAVQTIGRFDVTEKTDLRQFGRGGAVAVITGNQHLHLQ